jgi:hypothetical protein
VPPKSWDVGYVDAFVIGSGVAIDTNIVVDVDVQVDVSEFAESATVTELNGFLVMDLVVGADWSP